jgi:nitroreductase
MSSFSNPRQPEYDIDRQFIERWSARAFSEQPVEQEKLFMLLEAARWAPSAGNEQPWLFLLPDGPEELSRFRSLLNPSNQRWANQAPLLFYLAGRKKWLKSGRDNATFQFDCGSAFMSLALQAQRIGLIAHPMAGFAHDRAYDVLQVDQNDYEIMVAVAVGYYGNVQQLPEDLLAREQPTPRKTMAEIYRSAGQIATTN